MLAVFGVPAIHEDDAERAVRAALEMQAAMVELAADLRREGHPELSLRIGIETGEVLVDLGRASGERDRIVTGDAVNTAARLQQVATPGAIVVGPFTYAATRDVVDYEELPATVLKGKALPVAAWRAVAVKARRGGVRAVAGHRGAAHRARRGDRPAQGDRAPDGLRAPAAPGHGRRLRRRRQVAPDLGAGEVPRRAAGDLLLAQGPLPRLRPGLVLGAGRCRQGRRQDPRRRRSGDGAGQARGPHDGARYRW